MHWAALIIYCHVIRPLLLARNYYKNAFILNIHGVGMHVERGQFT